MDTTGNTSPLDDREPSQEASDERTGAQQPHGTETPHEAPAGADAAQSLPPDAEAHDTRAAEQSSEPLDEQPTEVHATPGASADGGLTDGTREAAAASVPPPVRPRSRPLTAEQTRMLLSDRRFTRRTRRYALHIRRYARARQSRRTRAFVRAAWTVAGVLAILIVTLLSASFAAAATYYQSEMAQVRALRQEVASQDSMRIYDSTGMLLYELRDAGFQHSIDIAHVPINAVNATVAIEDHDFWVNNGVDYTSIIRAALANYEQGGIKQGASSITQQLIKQQLLHDNSDDYSRKLREAILAVGITSSGAYSKSSIMELYLNSIGYASVAYGIDAAAQYYFGYSDDPRTGETAAQHLDIAQASMLAGIPQNPNLNDPRLNFPQAHSRQWDVLNAMVQYGYITQAQRDAAYRESAGAHFFHFQDSNTDLAPHFVNYVIGQLQSMIDLGQLKGLSRSGLNVYTTLNLSLNNFVQKTIQNHIHSCTEGTGYSGYVMCEANVTNGAAVIADNRPGQTGAIRVLIGSANYNDAKNNGQFDVATEGFRGPGSSMKPIVYATAFEKGWFPAMTIADEPTAFWDAGTGKPYQPLDYDRLHFKGEITLRHALQWSLNIPAVKVMQFAGTDAVRTNLNRLGVTDYRGTFGLSTVLGTLEVHPIEMVQAYSVFAHYGQYIPLYAINSISDSQGNVLYQYHQPAPVQVMDPRVAFLITSVLTDNAAREADFGGCSDLYLDPYTDQDRPWLPGCTSLAANHWVSSAAWPAAAKTGTGSDFRDDWTMGYTTDFTMGVWVGNNNDSEMINVDGIHGAAPIFKPSMIQAEESYSMPKSQFPTPKGVHQASYTSNNVTSTDWFINGDTLPNNSGSGATPFCFVTPPDSGPWQYCGAKGQSGGGGNSNGG
ncbi:MAG: transglycosylase domain-containing protein [Ktedonobacterales bacterium]